MTNIGLALTVNVVYIKTHGSSADGFAHPVTFTEFVKIFALSGARDDSEGAFIRRFSHDRLGVIHLCDKGTSTLPN